LTGSIDTLQPRRLWIDVGALTPLAILLAAVATAVYARFDGRGFDFEGHLDYLRYVDFSAALPLANQGWQFYQPPAYYVISVLAFEAVHRVGSPASLTEVARAVATAAWVMEGFIAVAAVHVARGNWVGMVAAGTLVWLLPGQSIMGSVVYVETLTGLGEAVLVFGMLAWSRGWGWGLACIGVGFPLAALSKFSGLAAVAAAIPILLWTSRHRLRATLLTLLPGAILVGAFYLRNLLVFHTPTPLNAELFQLRLWDPFQRWGIPPGFFTRFDQGLAQIPRMGRPCAAYDSFWGGAWKWLWGTDCSLLPWPNQVRGWLLAGAVLATVAVVIALAWIVTRAPYEAVLMVLVAVPVVVFIAFVAYVIEVPSGTADKGAYLLNAIVPAAVALGLLVSRVASRFPLALVCYVTILAWGVDMANASGVG
jgi:hypothetical protein